MQGGGIRPHAHPAPIHRLDVHRPERLDRAIAHVRAAETKAGAPPAALFLSLTALLTAQFRLIFRMLASRFLAGQVVQPTAERRPRQTMLIVQAGLMLNVSRSTIYRMIGAKQLRAIKVGARTVIPISSLDAILEGDQL